MPFAVASNPEFLKEGDAVNDFMKPDRVIIGTDDERARRHPARALRARSCAPTTASLVHGPALGRADQVRGERHLATRISFMNDIANLCERVGADIEMVRRGMGTDQRIGPKFLFPGLGFGGSCFPKDVQAVMAPAREVGHPLEILEAVHRVNERQKRLLADKIIAHFGGGSLAGKTIARVGPRVQARHRRHPRGAGAVAHRAAARGGRGRAGHDPVAIEATARAARRRASSCFEHNYEAATGADALVLVTEWHEFRRPNFERLKELMREPVLFDGRNMWEPSEVRELGFTYYGIGRG